MVLDRQRGSILVISLLLLLVLSLLGTLATTNSRIESQISTNDKTYKDAFVAAEYALVMGEMRVEREFRTDVALEMQAADSPADGLYGRGERPAWANLHWDALSPGTQGGAEALAIARIPEGMASIHNATNQERMLPRYTLEPMAPLRYNLRIGTGVPTNVSRFAVTARGIGATDNALGRGKPTQVILQTTYAMEP